MELRKAKKINRAQAGFSLIEVMAAAMIFTFGSLSLLSMMNIASSANHDSLAMMRANAIANSSLNKLLLMPVSQLPNGEGGEQFTVDELGNKTSENNGATDGSYSINWNIVRNAAGYADITVTVKWWDLTKRGAGKNNGVWRYSSAHGGRDL